MLFEVTQNLELISSCSIVEKTIVSKYKSQVLESQVDKSGPQKNFLFQR